MERACAGPSRQARLCLRLTGGECQSLGSRGVFIGLDRYGASAPYKVIYEKLGLTADAVVNAARAILVG